MNKTSDNGELDKSPFLFGVSDFSTSEPLQNAELIIAAGMDFIEPGLAKIAAMSDAEFEVAVERIRNNQINVQSCNWFLPQTLKVIGPDVDNDQTRQFLKHALGRAARLGATAVVFGSPGSRNVPDEFDFTAANVQMIQFCHLCSDVIRTEGWKIRIAVEHVNYTETNFVNSFAEAMSIVRQVNRSEIGLAADFYHFAMENESLETMREASDLICAVQLANPNGRCFPKPNADIPGLRSFLQILMDIGYEGGVSVEAVVGEDLQSDCRDAVQRLAGDVSRASQTTSR